MKKMVIFFVLFLLFSADSVFAQKEDPASDLYFKEAKKEAGFIFSMAEYGSGFGAFMVWPFGSKFHAGLTFDAYFLRDPKQIEIADPYYGGYYSYNKVNNVYLFNLFITVKRRFFAEDVDDSVRPFLSAGFGPIAGYNFPEIEELPDQSSWTLGGYAGAGVDITFDVKYFISARAQYRIASFPERLGVTSNHSMFELRFELGRRF